MGILNQGAFLSRFATATASHPVLRGVAVMRRLACLDLPDPVELDINVIPPVPDPNTPKTTRDLYAAHAADALCNSCHRTIDNFGFAFEQYDGMGAFRAQETVRAAGGTVMLPVDSETTVAGTGTDLDGDYADSNALARVPGHERRRARVHGPADIPRLGRAQRRFGARRRGQLRTASGGNCLPISRATSSRRWWPT